ncbi:MAG: response regulator [Bdellovibrionia bacterium]
MMEKLDLDAISPLLGDKLSVARKMITEVQSQFIVTELGTNKAIFDFEPVMKLLRQFGTLVQDIKFPPLNNLARDFETLIRLESIRYKMKLRVHDRTMQLLPFFSAICSRLEAILVSLKNSGKFLELKNADQTSEGKRRIVIIDESKAFQAILSKIFNSSKFFEVVGVAANAIEAEQLIHQVHPDLITLDILMPNMDGFAFISQLLQKYPIPVVLISAASGEHFEDVFDALYQGALDFIPKSNIEAKAEAVESIQKRIRAASNCSLSGLTRFYTGAPSMLDPGKMDASKVVALCAGFGSARTLLDVLRQLPGEVPPTIISQQISPDFSKFIIEKLQYIYPFTVKEAVDGEVLSRSKVLIIPYGKNATVHNDSGQTFIKISDAPDPFSLNVLLDSMAFSVGEKGVAVVLPSSNMDSLEGLLELKLAGGFVIVQEEDECLNPVLAREIIRTESASISGFGDKIGEILLTAVTEGKYSPNSNSQGAAVFTGKGPKVLIVDDSPTIRSYLSFNLRGLGLRNLCEGKNGSLAWDVLVESVDTDAPVELILCDQELPGTTGNLLLLKVRGDPRFKAVPFVLITAVADRETVLTAIKNGASDYITKPVHLKSLSDKVVTALKKKHKNG